MKYFGVFKDGEMVRFGKCADSSVDLQANEGEVSKELPVKPPYGIKYVLIDDELFLEDFK